MRGLAGDRPDTAGCVLVPTMGALHAGHEALIARAVREAAARGLSAGAVVSVFVNPTQFNDPADLGRYPRTLEADLAMCERLGAAAAYVPEPDDVYPPGADVPVGDLPAVATEPKLEDAHRPGHFAGVCQVVRRLFVLTRPAAAVFGEKDWQQLQVVRAMSDRESLGVEIIAEPTVREPDGLALSSRNVHLTPDERERALGISKALRAAGTEPSPGQAERTLRLILDAHAITPDYAAVRDARTLAPPTAATREFRMLVAAPVGKVRLLDNAPWPWMIADSV